MTELEVAAHAVASILRTRGVVYRADAVAMMLCEALGLGPDPATVDGGDWGEWFGGEK